VCAGRQRDAEVVGRRNEAEPRPDRLLLRLSGRPHLLPRVPPPEELGCWLERRCRSRGSRTYLGRKTAEQHARHPAACTCPAAARSRDHDTGQAGQARHARRPSTPRPWSGRGVPRSSAGNQRCERRRVMQAWRPPSHRGARTPSSSESESLEHHPEARVQGPARSPSARARIRQGGTRAKIGLSVVHIRKFCRGQESDDPMHFGTMQRYIPRPSGTAKIAVMREGEF